MNKILKTISLIFVAIISAFSPLSEAYATLDDKTLNKYAQNDILYYDPTENNCNSPSETMPTGSQITWIGDSYSVGAQSIIDQTFSGVDYGSSVNDANSYIQVSKTVSGGSSSNPSGMTILEKLIKDNKVRGYIVFALGTNSYWTDADLETLDGLISQTSSKVILVNSKTPNDDYADSNKRLASFASSHDRYSLADWAAVYNAEYFDADPEKIHPAGDGGYKAWVGSIEDALKSRTSTSGNGSVNISSNSLPSETISLLESAGVKEKAEQNMSAYQAGAESQNIPWQVLAALHYREGGMNSNLSIADGEPLGTGTSVDGAAIGNNLTEDAILAAEHFVSMGKMVYDIDISSDFTYENLAENFLAYNRGFLYKWHGMTYEDSPYVMNYLDESHIGMSFPNSAGETVPGIKDTNAGALAVYLYLGGSLDGYTAEVCCDDGSSTVGGVTTTEIEGHTYAFPLAGASKDNYLNPGKFDSVLSTLACESLSCHHDYHALDMGVMMEEISGNEKEKYGYGSGGFSEMYYYSSGAQVVAFTSGTIQYAKNYSNGVPSDWVSKCGQIGLKGDDGNFYWLGHLSSDFAVSSGDHVDAGQLLGYVGAPQCAQNTQAHLHIDNHNGTNVKSDTWTIEVMNQLWEKLPESGTSSGSGSATVCSNGNVSEDGLTYEQAKQFMINYGANKNNSSADAVGGLWEMCNGGGSNCVTFSAFFMNKFTNTNVGSSPGNGYQVVSNLKSRGIETGTEPKVWSVFSWGDGGNGHTGVVLGYHDGEWIVGHASCSNSGRGAGDGTKEGGGSGFVFKSSDIVQAVWGVSTNLEFAYFGDQVKTSDISSYLDNGV